MPSGCSIRGCRMTKKMSIVIGLNLSFHHIPKRDNVRPYWVSKCKPNINLKTDVVCSLHFKPEDFERDLKSELLNLKPKVLLKPTAIPTVKVDISADEKIAISINESNQYYNNQLTEIQQIKVKTKNVACQSAIDKPLTEEQIKYLRELEKKVCDLVLDNNDLERKLAKKELLTTKLKYRVKTLSQTTTYLKRKQFKASKKYMNEIIGEKLKKIFPKGRLKKIIREINWNEKDFCVKQSSIKPPIEDELGHQEKDILTHREYVATLSRDDRGEYLAAWIIDKIKLDGKIKGKESDHTYAINKEGRESEEQLVESDNESPILLNLLKSSDSCKQNNDNDINDKKKCVKKKIKKEG